MFYIDSMRAVPVLVVLVWGYFALPIVTGVDAAAVLGGAGRAVAHIAAYVAEIVRAGVASVRPGQTRAALALGMSHAQAIREIILPQAIVRMLPAFGSIISITIKDTAIASVIAVPEYMNRSQTLAGESFRPIEVFLVAMAVYFVILFPDHPRRGHGLRARSRIWAGHEPRLVRGLAQRRRAGARHRADRGARGRHHG